MYTTILTLHSWLRWLALIAGIMATVSAARGKGDKPGLVLTIALDTQLLLGLILYITQTLPSIQGRMAEVMKDPAARFFAVEHITMMLGAVIATHVGRVLGRKGAPETRNAKQMVCYGIATAFMLLAIPWPGLRAGRPLFRGLGI
jgi:hypothetical protein